MEKQKQIKFKVWNSAKKEWFVPTYEAYKGNLHDISITLSGKIMQRTFTEPADIRNNHDFITVQFTGLKDVHGKEIYEGDILQEIYEDKAEESGFGKTIVEVVFKNGAFGWIGDITKKFFSFDSEPLDTFEIVGNTFENSELLHTGALAGN